MIVQGIYAAGDGAHEGAQRGFCGGDGQGDAGNIEDAAAGAEVKSWLLALSSWLRERSEPHATMG